MSITDEMNQSTNGPAVGKGSIDETPTAQH